MGTIKRLCARVIQVASCIVASETLVDCYAVVYPLIVRYKIIVGNLNPETIWHAASEYAQVKLTFVLDLVCRYFEPVFVFSIFQDSAVYSICYVA